MLSSNPPFETIVRPYGKAAIAEAARLIRAGYPVAVPTETVYGLAADATNGEAVARIYEAKERPSFNPLIVHVLDLAAAEEIGVFDDVSRRLAQRYWPGPLTIVVPLRRGNSVASIVTAGLDTIAIRSPAHPAIRDLLKATALPLAAPSANRSGRLSPTNAAHVLASLDGEIPFVIDGGGTDHGVESTIVRVQAAKLVLLRHGPVLTSAIALANSPEIIAPGQLAGHYAPEKPLRINAMRPAVDEWMIGFGSIPGHETLSASGNLIEAAARLFVALHNADISDLPKIAVAAIPSMDLGLAINDRLARAALDTKTLAVTA
ncbi:MAG: threonylcarbamoyl-AMP synthase [Sphingomonadales bacterium]|nr:threonylcarbamoyl-AMP synthase [Sphingomonadales bacterium]